MLTFEVCVLPLHMLVCVLVWMSDALTAGQRTL